MFLQETHSKEESETQWKNEWGGKVTIFKSRLIPKLVYVSSLLPTSSNITKISEPYNIQLFMEREI